MDSTQETDQKSANKTILLMVSIKPSSLILFVCLSHNNIIISLKDDSLQTALIKPGSYKCVQAAGAF